MRGGSGIQPPPQLLWEATLWWGYFVIAQNARRVLAVFQPCADDVPRSLRLGVAMLERTQVRRKPGYADYINSVSVFIPLPPGRQRR
jgi:steroid 5-alpha reductase family enzyme